MAKNPSMPEGEAWAIATKQYKGDAKEAELEVSNFVAHRLTAPEHLLAQVAEPERAERAYRFGDHHHVTLLQPQELRALKHKGYTPQMIQQAFENATEKSMQLGDKVHEVRNQGRVYSIAPVTWDAALAARKSLGLGNPKYPLHMTVGVRPDEELQKAAEDIRLAAFQDELRNCHELPEYLQKLSAALGVAL
jgi:hypothetical protein